MKIGRLNRRVDILEFVTKRDEYGGEEGEWRKVQSLWATIEPVSGTEFFQSQTVNAESVVKITLRYNPTITVLNRVQYQGTMYEIIGVTDTHTAHRATVLNCKEKVNDGLLGKAEEG